VLDEAHHLLPGNSEMPVWESMTGTILATVDPASLRSETLRAVDVLVTPRISAERTIQKFCERTGIAMPSIDRSGNGNDEVLVWFTKSAQRALSIKPERVKRAAPRHARKYAEADLGEDGSFFFTGPENKLNLKAQNLKLFVQMASGVDEDTWLYHLKRHDYSRWFRESLKDEHLANEAERIEHDHSDSADESRSAMTSAIEQRYTAPA
jgi:hypothetical protein